MTKPKAIPLPEDQDDLNGETFDVHGLISTDEHLKIPAYAAEKTDTLRTTILPCKKHSFQYARRDILGLYARTEALTDSTGSRIISLCSWTRMLSVRGRLSGILARCGVPSTFGRQRVRSALSDVVSCGTRRSRTHHIGPIIGQIFSQVEAVFSILVSNGWPNLAIDPLLAFSRRISSLTIKYMEPNHLLNFLSLLRGHWSLSQVCTSNSSKSKNVRLHLLRPIHLCNPPPTSAVFPS